MIFQFFSETFAVTGIPPNLGVPIYAGPVTNGWQMLLVALPAVLAFMTSCIAAYVSVKNQKKLAETAGRMQDLHVLVNSRLDALVEATRKSAHAEGVIEGKKNEKADEVVRVDLAARTASELANAIASGSVDKTKTVPKPDILFVPDTRPSG